MRESVVARWRTVVALGAAGVLAVGLTGAGSAGADAIRFSASATADGGRLAFLVPGASVSDQIIDGGGPVAQADLDSLGSSRAFASTPYPGELGVIGPGIVASLINAPQPPPYPFIAQSRHPSTPEQHVEYGQFFKLQAKSDETSSSATAATSDFGGDAKFFASRAEAKVSNTGDEVAAQASNRFEGLVAGPLQIVSVVSSAAVNRSPGSEATRASSLVVTGASINGQAVGFSDKGFVVGANATPLPPSDPLLKALAQAGVTVSYLSPEATPSGVVAPGLRIVTVREIPGAARTATLALTLGRASATVEASTESVGLPADSPAGSTDNDAAQFEGPVADQAPVPNAAVAAAPSPVETTPVVETPIVLPAPPAFDPGLRVGDSASTPVSGAGTGKAAALAPSSGGAGQSAAPRLARRVRWSKPIDTGRVMYPLLLAAGVFLFGGVHAARRVGVKP
jgi:hypothetical protein